MTQVKNIHIFVEGRVQGVGFRRFAQVNALKLNLKGWTRNLLDGRVEIKATGDVFAIDQYTEIIRKGPSFSNVRSVEFSEASEAELGDFEIKPDEDVP